MKIHILRINDCGVQRGQLDYAVKEIRHFLEEYTTAIVAESGAAPADAVAPGSASIPADAAVPGSASTPADAAVELFIDQALAAHCYDLHGDGKTLKISGGSPSAVLCGVYEALADAGILFEATGYSACGGFDLDAFLRVTKSVRPKSRLRGIRQHINFPMDISSYPLKDAQEYIRDLARMRYNALTFHSYAGQWHSTEPDDPDNVAGHFFYGQHHPVTQKDPLTASRIHNRKTWCIPEVESIYDDEKARGEYAQYWLNQLMDTVKEVGMELTLSVELPFDDVEKNYRMLHEVCKTYPQIDVLELLSYESGGDDRIAGLTTENVEKVMADMFGTGVLDPDGRLEGMGESIPGQFPGGAVSLKRILDALEHRDKWLEGLEKKPALRGGLYITSTEALKILWPILRKCAPADVTKSLLPAHGALAVADTIEAIGFNEQDWQNTMVYSWAEFDGNMYIQQLSTDGLEKLAFMPEADSIYGFCINHWRTSENKLTISYGAKTAIAPMTAADYYRDYAAQTKIGDAEGFAAACEKLAQLDTYNRDNLFNIGFCYVGCWIRANGVTPPRSYPEEAQKRAIAVYTELEEAFGRILPTAGTKEAIALLRLLMNRCRTSVLHIQSMLKLDEIKKIYDYDDPKPLTEKEKAAIDEIVEKSHAYAQQYIHLYGEMLPDRGCQGLVVSYYETTPVFIDVVAGHFDDSIEKAEREVFDAPPSPDTEAK